MEHKPPYVVDSNALYEYFLNWAKSQDASWGQLELTEIEMLYEAFRQGLAYKKHPRWYCPRCQGRHYLEIDVLPAVLRLTCSSCKAKWNVQITFTSATAKGKRRASEDDILTDWDTGATIAEDAQEVV